MMRLLPALLLLLSTPALAAMPAAGNGYGAIDARRDIAPLDLARRFCDARRAGDMTAVERFFAPKLKLARLVAARAEADIPWQTHDQQPTSCSFEVVNGFDDTIGVLIRITYTAGGLRWSDTLTY